jgi:hypothetical protein
MLLSIVQWQRIHRIHTDPDAVTARIYSCWDCGATNVAPSYCDVFTVLKTPFGLLLLSFTTSLVVTTITFYNVRSSLPCWFFILVGPLIAGFLVAALLWLLWSPMTLRLWSAPLSSLTLRLWSAPSICLDVAYLIGSYDLLWRSVFDRFLWSALTLRLWSVPFICPYLRRSPSWNRVLAPRIEDT